VTRKRIVLVNPEDGKQVSQVNASSDDKTTYLQATDYLKPSDLFFTLTSDSTVVCFSGGFLKKKLSQSLSKLQHVTAVSAYVEDVSEYLVVASSTPDSSNSLFANSAGGARDCNIKIFKIDELCDSLQLIYVCSHANQ